jgi:hypothetical protein
MATWLQSHRTRSAHCDGLNLIPAVAPDMPGRAVHYATCTLLGVLAMSLSVTAVGLVVATERTPTAAATQTTAPDASRSVTQRSTRDGVAGDSARQRRGAKAAEPQPASVPADVPIRDQQSYMEALRRCALAQTKQERENCE